MNLSQLQSKMGSALGIPLSRLRGSGSQIGTSATRASIMSQVISNDAASMYPTVMGTMNSMLGRELVKKYYVSKEYPFSLKRCLPIEIMEETLKANIMGESAYDEFDRRYDAEYDLLSKECTWSNGDWERDLRNKKLLETFDEDHPEWLI